MSGFVARWSRRKAATTHAEATPAPVEAPVLPPVEALDAASDFTAFLQAGVAAAVQASALRVAWETDPRIADFRGMAEYDWDFNAVGYGRLAPGDNVAALLQRLISPSPPATKDAAEPGLPAIAADVRPTPPQAKISVDRDVTAQVAASSAAPGPQLDAALVECDEDADTVAPRRHGGALPS